MALHVYKGTITVGGTDGQLCSENDTETNPLSMSMDADGTANTPVMFAVRCDTGEEIKIDTTFQAYGTNADKWAFAPDNSGAPGTWGDFGGTITFAAGSIQDKNVAFWAKSKALSTEDDGTDNTTDLRIVTKVGPI